jgi:Terminase RNaseH-like domain
MRKEEYDLDDFLCLGFKFDDRPGGPDGESCSTSMAGKILRVRDRNGNEIALKPNAIQQRFERERRQHNIVVKARQMGMTTWIAARFFLKTITAHGILTVQVAQTREAAESIFRIVQRFWDCLPDDLRTGPLRRSRANIGQMIFPKLDSEFRVVSASDENAGRGLTIQNLHCSELSRWPGDAAATLAGLRAALAPTGELVMESTPNGAYGCFYNEWLKAAEKGVAKHFYPWWMEEAYISAAAKDLRDDERALMQQHNLSTRQIGFRRGLEASYRGLRTQEFAEDPELCFRATGECCFDIEAIESRIATVQNPVEIRRGEALQIWLPPISGRKYLIAVDTAGGGSDGDYAAVQVLDLETGAQCAELQQRLGPLELARVAATLGREYGGALIAVERNNHGSGVLAYLDAVERYTRVYEQSGVAGWLTTAGSKPGMISRLGALLMESPWMFRSRRLLEECRTFVTHPGGRTGAANGAHDDCLMAMALAHAVRAERIQSTSHRSRAA